MLFGIVNGIVKYKLYYYNKQNIEFNNSKKIWNNGIKNGHAIWYQRTCYLVSADMLFGIVNCHFFYHFSLSQQAKPYKKPYPRKAYSALFRPYSISIVFTFSNNTIEIYRYTKKIKKNLCLNGNFFLFFFAGHKKSHSTLF